MQRSVCDTIMTDYRQYCVNCQLKTPRFKSDHRAVVATLRLGSVKHHRRYVKRRSNYPIQPVEFPDGDRADTLLSDLQEAVTPPTREESRISSWISEATWQLIDQKALARRLGNWEQVRALKRPVRRALVRDRVSRAKAVAAQAQVHLEAGNIQKAFGAIKGWYRDARPWPPTPSQADLAVTRGEQAALHAPRETPHDHIPIHVEPYAINDDPPMEELFANSKPEMLPVHLA